MTKMESVNQKRTPFTDILYQLLAGAGSGILTKSAVAPLERIKILLQIQGMIGTSRKYVGVWQTCRLIVQEEGFLALYKGNGANITRIIPVYALKFMFNDSIRDLIRRPGQGVHDMDVNQLLAAGCLAGLFQSVLTCPLEVVRTRLTMGAGLGRLQYKGIMDCGRRIVVEEGASGLYKGLGAILITAAPYVGLQMTFYDLFKGVFPKNEKGKSSIWWSLLAGASAGLCAQTITYPGDTIKRRMQANGVAGSPRVYQGTFHCIKLVFQQEGWRAYYKGLRANVIKCLPEAAIQFATYDLIKAALGLPS